MSRNIIACRKYMVDPSVFRSLIIDKCNICGAQVIVQTATSDQEILCVECAFTIFNTVPDLIMTIKRPG